MTATIAQVHAWEALDSRGRPTVACRVGLDNAGIARVVVPSGASTGSHEATEKRDGELRYAGHGVTQAVESVNTVIAPALIGQDARDQAAIDALLERLDGSEDLHNLGSNAVLSASLATAIAVADGQRLPLWMTLAGDTTPLIPLPMVNIVSGGAHAGRSIDIQDVLAVPVGAHSFSQAMEWVDRVRRACADLMQDAGWPAALVADEGGLSGHFPTNEAALELVTRGIEAAKLSPGQDVSLAVDVAANQITRDSAIHLNSENLILEPEEWLRRIESWTRRYPVVSWEDIFDEDAWEAWEAASRALTSVQLLGDDLFATQESRLVQGISRGVANAVLVKVNQAGTLTRARQVLRRAQANGYATVVSARSGDSEDSWLADLAVGWNAGQIKVGSTMRSERTAKWNRLLEIESDGNSEYAGATALRNT